MRLFPAGAREGEGGRSFAFLTPLLAALCLLALLAGPCLAQEDETFTARREFRGLVRRDMAEHCARLAAEIAAFEQAARQLAREPDLHFADTSGSGGLAAPLPLDGLARALFSAPVTLIGAEGFPPNLQAVVTVRLQAPENLRAVLLPALQYPARYEIYGQILAWQRHLLARYDALAAGLLQRRPESGGGMEQGHLLQNALNEMIALELMLEILPLYNEHWSDPVRAGAELEKAGQLAPDNPLVLTGLAEVQLQLDRPVPALEHIRRALALTPDFARAHDVKGAVLLRQSLPTLAVEAFGQAIALAPKNPAYYTHRASAYLVLEEKEPMCADFQSACGLGRCEGLQWARIAGLCRSGGER